MRHHATENRRWPASPFDPPLPSEWISWVNNPEPEAELTALRHCNRRGLPFGNDDWVKNSTVRLGLKSTIRPGGRPRKRPDPFPPSYVQRMKTRWGSCNSSAKTIRLNTDLAKKPRECLEYIVVHEMIHILEPTHNERFQELMGRFMPDWQHRRQVLNRLPVRHEEWDY
jgi:hypothetical protein